MSNIYLFYKKHKIFQLFSFFRTFKTLFSIMKFKNFPQNKVSKNVSSLNKSERTVKYEIEK